jgi:hypothetical protein
MRDDTPSTNEFERRARQGEPGIAREFLEYLRHTRKWWISPVILLLFLLAGLIVLGGTGAAPFIYTLF